MNICFRHPTQTAGRQSSLYASQQQHQLYDRDFQRQQPLTIDVIWAVGVCTPPTAATAAVMMAMARQSKSLRCHFLCSLPPVGCRLSDFAKAIGIIPPSICASRR